MFGKEKIYTGISDEFLQRNGANTEIGRMVRSADAKRLLEEMQKHEAMVCEREKMALECSDRIESMLAQHRLSAEYLISFGVPSEHRKQLGEVLGDVAQNGGLTLRTAIDLANARVVTIDSQTER